MTKLSILASHLYAVAHLSKFCFSKFPVNLGRSRTIRKSGGIVPFCTGLEDHLAQSTAEAG